MSHSTESVGSNDTSQKLVIGKRKRETDSSASSKIMANCKCPALRENDHYRVSAAVMLKRLTHNNSKGIDKIVLPEGTDYWVEIIKIANQGMNDLSVERVIALAKEIREFHRSSPCECYGKALCDDVTDLGAPKFPGEDEISMLHSGKSSLINVPSQNKRMRTFEGDVSTSQTLERRTPQEELCRAPHVRAESNGVWVMRMMNHYDFPSDIKSTLAAKLLDNPSMFPLIVGFDEKTLLSFIRGVSDEGLFNTWYMEWTARNLS